MIFSPNKYKWQHRVSSHIHGFVWLTDAPDFDKLDWNNEELVENAISYIDKYVSAWNP